MSIPPVDVIHTVDMDPLLKAIGELIGTNVAEDSVMVMLTLSQMMGEMITTADLDEKKWKSSLKFIGEHMNIGVQEVLQIAGEIKIPLNVIDSAIGQAVRK